MYLLLSLGSERIFWRGVRQEIVISARLNSKKRTMVPSFLRISARDPAALNHCTAASRSSIARSILVSYRSIPYQSNVLSDVFPRIFIERICNPNIGPQDLDRLVPARPLDQVFWHFRVLGGRDEAGSE